MSERVIWKYPLRHGAKGILIDGGPLDVVHVGVDPGGEPCAWAAVVPGRTRGATRLVLVGTGRPLPEGMHVGAFVDGPFVWHVVAARVEEQGEEKQP